MAGLKIDYNSEGESPMSSRDFDRLKRRAEKEIREDGTLSSESGMSALFAIEWCRAQKMAWRVTEHTDGSYFVEVVG